MSAAAVHTIWPALVVPLQGKCLVWSSWDMLNYVLNGVFEVVLLNYILPRTSFIRVSYIQKPRQLFKYNKSMNGYNSRIYCLYQRDTLLSWMSTFCAFRKLWHNYQWLKKKALLQPGDLYIKFRTWKKLSLGRSITWLTSWKEH